jgi:hypothetical protein
VPADRNIYFQGLDEHYLAIQTERTTGTTQPGESRTRGLPRAGRAGATVQNLAVSGAERRSVPRPAGPRVGQKVFDYERQIQPFWTRAAPCHDEKAAAGLDLLRVDRGKTSPTRTC